MLDITFYKKQNNDNFVPCTIELCDEDYKKLIVSNFAKRFHSEKQCLIVEEEEYSIDAVYCNALVLKGVHIGDNAVIGAGSVVTKDVPANCVAAGNPAVVVKHIEGVE